LPKLGGFLTKNGEVRLERVEQILYELGKIEGDIFRRRREKEERRMANEKRRKDESQSSQRVSDVGVPEVASHLMKNFDSAAYATPVASTHGRGLLVTDNNTDLQMSQASNSELVAQKVEMQANGLQEKLN
jgi:5'-3' exonuclease